MKHTSKRLVAFGLAAAVALSGIATATTYIKYQFTGDMTRTAVTGHSSSVLKTHYGPNVSTGIYGVSMWEEADQAIAFQVNQAKLAPSGGGLSQGSVIKFAGYNERSKKTVSLGTGHYVEAVKICTNGNKSATSKKRLKGLKLYGARLLADGSIQSGVTSASFKRANCKQWEQKVACPKGQLASAITMYRGDKGINGVSLLCRKVVRKESVGR